MDMSFHAFFFRAFFGSSTSVSLVTTYIEAISYNTLTYSFFANQCSLIPNNSILPSELKLLTEHLTLISCNFSETDILQIINSHYSNKAHGHDMICILMLKICGEAIICKPLNIIFKTCLNTGKFLSEWKKGNVVPIHKKMTSEMLKTTFLYPANPYMIRYLNA